MRIRDPESETAVTRVYLNRLTADENCNRLDIRFAPLSIQEHSHGNKKRFVS